MVAQTLITSAALMLPLGFLLGAAVSAAQLRRSSTALPDLIEQLLPQTQCGECGYAGCQPYANAVAQGGPINRCAPGGQTTVKKIAQLLDVAELPLDIEGEPKPKAVAFIREAECIGCTKCIQACPVDAIVGAAKQMHTVIADECTGCDLCVAPCPVDCIEMRPVAAALPAIAQHAECIRCGQCAETCPVALQPQQLYRSARAGDGAELIAERLFDCIECGACTQVCPSEIPLVQYYRAAKIDLRGEQEDLSRAQLAKGRFAAHQIRVQRETEQKAARLAMRLEQAREKMADTERAKSKQDIIREAIARAKAKKSGQTPADDGTPS